MYGMHLRERRIRQGKRRGVNDDGEALKGDGKALSGDGEVLKTEGMKGNEEAPHMCKIAMVGNEMNRALGHLCAHIG